MFLNHAAEQELKLKPSNAMRHLWLQRWYPQLTEQDRNALLVDLGFNEPKRGILVNHTAKHPSGIKFILISDTEAYASGKGHHTAGYLFPEEDSFDPKAALQVYLDWMDKGQLPDGYMEHDPDSLP